MASTTRLDPKPIDVVGADGFRIRTWDHGGNGPPLFLTHCTGTHARIWDPLVPDLVDRFHVYSADTRGHGDSDKPQNPDAYDWSRSGDDFLRTIEHISAGTPVRAVGHSAGAAHICYAALARPQQFEKAILMEPIIGPREFFRHENPMVKRAGRRRTIFESPAEARARYAAKPPMNRWRPDLLDAYIDHGFTPLPDGQVALKCPGVIEAYIYERGGCHDLFERLGDLMLCSLLVAGGRSDVRHLVELQSQRLAGSELRLIEGASHFLMQEKPEEVLALILNWLT